MVHIIGSQGLVNNSVFASSEQQGNIFLSGQNQNGLTIDNAGKSMHVMNSNFTNLTASEGSGIIVQATGNTTIENCTFFNNTAFKGGAIEIKNTDHVLVKNNTFFQNTAEQDPGVEVRILRDAATFRGGAIYFDCITGQNITNTDPATVAT